MITEATQQIEVGTDRAPSIGADSEQPRRNVFDAWRLQPVALEEFGRMGSAEARLTRAQLHYLMKFGVLAPTTHNTVPQRFRIDPESGRLSLLLDRRFVLPESDPSGRQATISCGCVLAHLAIAAGAYGWQAVPQFATVETSATQPLAECSPRYSELVRISFSRIAQPCYEPRWLTAMVERRMVRAEYDPSFVLDEEAITEMTRIASQYDPVCLHILTDSPSLMVLGKFQELADTTVFNRHAFARELGDWLFPNEHPSPLGMRGREFGLNDEAALRFHLGLRGQRRLLPDEIAALAKSGNLGMRSASAVIVLTVREDSVFARLQAGQAFAKLALTLALRGYVVSMHAAITEVDAPNLALRGRLRTTARPVVVFRTGKPANLVDAQRPHAARPDLRDLILE